MKSLANTLSNLLGTAALAIGLLSGCAGTPPAPAQPPQDATPRAGRSPVVEAPFVAAGEAIDAQVTIRGITVAQGRVAVVESSTADELRVQASGTASIPLVHPALMTSDTWLGTVAGFPNRYLTSTQLGSKKRTYDVVFGGDHFRYHYRRNFDSDDENVVPIPERKRPHDAVSTLLMLRTWRPFPGTRQRVFVALGRRLWRVDVVFEGPVRLTEQHGKQTRETHAVAFSGKGKCLHPDPDRRVERRFRVWFSDDERRVPLKVTMESRLGEIELRTRSYVYDPPRRRSGSPEPQHRTGR